MGTSILLMFIIGFIGTAFSLGGRKGQNEPRTVIESLRRFGFTVVGRLIEHPDQRMRGWLWIEGHFVGLDSVTKCRRDGCAGKMYVLAEATNDPDALAWCPRRLSFEHIGMFCNTCGRFVRETAPKAGVFGRLEDGANLHEFLMALSDGKDPKLVEAARQAISDRRERLLEEVAKADLQLAALESSEDTPYRGKALSSVDNHCRSLPAYNGKE